MKLCMKEIKQSIGRSPVVQNHPKICPTSADTGPQIIAVPCQLARSPRNPDECRFAIEGGIGWQIVDRRGRTANALDINSFLKYHFHLQHDNAYRIEDRVSIHCVTQRSSTDKSACRHVWAVAIHSKIVFNLARWRSTSDVLRVVVAQGVAFNIARDRPWD